MKVRTFLLAVVLGLWAGGTSAAQDPGVSPTAEETSAEEALTGSEEPAVATPAGVKVEVRPEQVTVGGRVRAEITVAWMGRRPSEPARFPTWQESWGRAEVLSASEVEAFEDQSGRYVYKQTVELTAFEVGEVELPSARIALPLGDETVEIATEGTARFEVVSVLPQEADAEGSEEETDPDAPVEEAGGLEPRPPAPPRELQHARQAFLVTTGLLIALLATGLYVLLRRLADQKLPEETPFRRRVDPLTLLQPLEELMSRLDRVDPDYVKPAHTGLSFALRRYLARRLGFPAVESTTTEIQQHLRGLRLPADMGGRAIQLLKECDLVKFAGVEVSEQITRDRVETARDLARRLEERFKPAVDPTGPSDESTPGASP